MTSSVPSDVSEAAIRTYEPYSIFDLTMLLYPAGLNSSKVHLFRTPSREFYQDTPQIAYNKSMSRPIRFMGTEQKAIHQ